jgi:hypothetical protein
MEANDKKATVPPYVAYRTLQNFLERFKNGLPSRIDRGLMSSMSGAAQSQVTTALRYLGMISENNLTNEILRRYVGGEESERKLVLKEVLERSYPFIFKSDFDFSTATGSQLREVFEENTSASGETVARCMNFLKDAAQDAGLQVSPFLSHKKSRTRASRKRTIPARREEAKDAEKGKTRVEVREQIQERDTPRVAAQESLLLWGLFQRLPKPGTSWPKDEKDRWMQTLNNVLSLEYPD